MRRQTAFFLFLLGGIAAWFVLHMGQVDPLRRFAVALALLVVPPLIGLVASFAAAHRSRVENRELRRECAQTTRRFDMRPLTSFLTGTTATFAAVYAIHAFTLWDAAFILHMGSLDPLSRFPSAVALIGLPLVIGVGASLGSPFSSPSEA